VEYLYTGMFVFKNHAQVRPVIFYSKNVIAARKIVAVQKIPWEQSQDVAPAGVFLASDAACRVTGTTYDISAGDSVKYIA
jgi:hypothetical protein